MYQGDWIERIKTHISSEQTCQYPLKRKEKQMKKLFLLIGLLMILSGCAVGFYDGRGFHGVAIGPPYPYYEPYYPDGYYYSHGPKHYPYPAGRYYRGPAYYR